jgi:hypothetical protein
MHIQFGNAQPQVEFGFKPRPTPPKSERPTGGKPPKQPKPPHSVAFSSNEVGVNTSLKSWNA